MIQKASILIVVSALLFGCQRNDELSPAEEQCNSDNALNSYYYYFDVSPSSITPHPWGDTLVFIDSASNIYEFIVNNKYDHELNNFGGHGCGGCPCAYTTYYHYEAHSIFAEGLQTDLSIRYQHIATQSGQSVTSIVMNNTMDPQMLVEINPGGFAESSTYPTLDSIQVHGYTYYDVIDGNNMAFTYGTGVVSFNFLDTTTQTIVRLARVQ